MSPGADAADFAGISWGSNHFRAYRIGPDGAVVDAYARAQGVLGMDRTAMAEAIAELAVRWTGLSAIWASGMIGSALGWAEVPYAQSPAGGDELVAAAVVARIGPADVRIVPGITCTRRADDGPDILRGEEVELLGLSAAAPDGLVILPGAHPKWVALRAGRVADFFTALSGELFDRITEQGLLASLAQDRAEDGPAFHDGLAAARISPISLGTLLFGARARVMRNLMPKQATSSYLRGLLIGAELADAARLLPDLARGSVRVVGDNALADLYVAALASQGIAARAVDAETARIDGFRALQAADRRTGRSAPRPHQRADTLDQPTPASMDY